MNESLIEKQNGNFANTVLPAVVGLKKYSVIYADPAWKYNNQSPPCLPEKQPDTCKIEYYYPLPYDDYSRNKRLES